MDFSVVVPVYGCPAALEELHDRLVKTFNKMGKSYEIILVNDKCPRNSIEVIHRICEMDKNTIGIDLSRNFGQQRAIMAGLDYSSGDYVVVMDCDLQDRPEDIEQMFIELNKGFDVVFARNSSGKKLKLTSKLFYKVHAKATGVDFDDKLSNFSVSKRVVIDSLCQMRELYRAFTSYIKWMGFKIGYVDVIRDARKEGKSGYTFKKRLRLATDILFSQSDIPLKFVLYSGIFNILFAFLFEFAFVVRSVVLHNFAILLTPTLFSTIFLSTGIVSTAIGIIGLYVGRTFSQVKQRPLYIIRETINDKKLNKTK